jgi:hypothetical protein
LQQIRDKRYADRFRADGKEIVALGVNFDAQQRKVSDWKAVGGW